jgi:hypothetical protein
MDKKNVPSRSGDRGRWIFNILGKTIYLILLSSNTSWIHSGASGAYVFPKF